MSPIPALLILAVTTASAQPPSKTDLLKLADQVEAAIQASDWPKAAELSRSLKSAVDGARNQSMAAGATELADSVLNWLPADTETLVVAQQPFTLRERDETKIPSALAQAQWYATLLLGAPEKQELFKRLTGRTVRFAALGARRFGESPPHNNDRGGLGMIVFQGCGIYAFTEPLPDPLIARPTDDAIMGHRVWLSQGKLNEGPDEQTYVVSLLKPDLLMSCDDREFFREMVTRMGMPAQRIALPASLLEWKHVDRAAPLWGIAHYRTKGLLTAMLSSEGAVGATGVTVAFGLASGAVKARMMAKSDPWKQLAGSGDFHGAAASRQIAEGVWELSVEGKPEAAMFAAFGLMAYLGFAILV